MLDTECSPPPHPNAHAPHLPVRPLDGNVKSFYVLIFYTENFLTFPDKMINIVNTGSSYVCRLQQAIVRKTEFLTAQHTRTIYIPGIYYIYYIIYNICMRKTEFLTAQHTRTIYIYTWSILYIIYKYSSS